MTRRRHLQIPNVPFTPDSDRDGVQRALNWVPLIGIALILLSVFNTLIFLPLGSALFLFGLWLPVRLRFNEPGSVIASRRRDGLALSPPLSDHLVLLIVGILLTVGFLAVVAFTDRSRRAGGAVLAGLLMALAGAWGLIFRPALCLSPDGLRTLGVLWKRFDLPWSRIGAARAVGARPARLRLITSGTSPLVPNSCVGGDPAAVAAVIEYYRQHPDERHRLRDGVAAIEHLMAEIRAGHWKPKG